MTREVTQLRVGAKTDPGRKRELNEDDFIIVEMFKDKENLAVAEKKGNIYIVADGVGGHNAGEVASRMAVDIVSQRYYEDESPNVRASLVRAIQEANRQIFERAQSVRSETGMGSTIVAAAIRGHELHIAHAGDSRAYLVRQGRIKQLTKDHSWVSEQLAQRRITSEEARTHPYRSYITRSLGAKPEVEPECTAIAIRRGDTILLCSDGLSGQVDDETILQIVSSLDPTDACNELVHLANEAGGPDNITAIVIRVEQVISTLLQYGTDAPTQIPKERPRREGPKRRESKREKRKLSAKSIIIGLVVAIVICLCTLLALYLFQREQLLQEKEQELWQIGGTATEMASLLSASATTSAPPSSPQTPNVTEQTFPTETRMVALVFTDTPIPTPMPTETAIRSSFPTSTATPTPSPVPIVLPVDTATFTPSPTPGPWLRVLIPALNARAKPRMGDDVVLGQFHRGDVLQVIGRSRYGDWLKVCCLSPDEIEVWVSSRAGYVQVSVPLKTLPVVE